MNIAHDVHDFEADYYLAGPMTGLPEYNYPYFAAVALRLRFIGFRVHSPHEVQAPAEKHGMMPDELWEYYMAATKKMMEKCNAIILLKGWNRSKGAKIELNYALDHDWPVYFYLDPPGRPINMSRL